MRVILGLYFSVVLLSTGASSALAMDSPHAVGQAQIAHELHQFNRTLTLDSFLYQPISEIDDSDDADQQPASPALFLISSLALSILALSATIFGFNYHYRKSHTLSVRAGLVRQRPE